MMVKEVRQIEGEMFSEKIALHYEKTGETADIVFGPHGEGLISFTVRKADDGGVREQTPFDAMQELSAILFPGEDLVMLSIYRAKENVFSGETVYIAVESVRKEP